ncbi:hypothetical protein IW261DRAFT_841703 [Armillaria novae-zelandiae]|uniref:Uncharacterized protein n=1 Tax=Armillaria novae-zelandiae TaxID=153914 RepID=A0AA39PHR3_9AGAR|nr:hypothetical protein IW261DRAFT_841703 [Armillaria novae-zelandiae]
MKSFFTTILAVAVGGNTLHASNCNPIDPNFEFIDVVNLLDDGTACWLFYSSRTSMSQDYNVNRQSKMAIFDLLKFVVWLSGAFIFVRLFSFQRRQSQRGKIPLSCASARLR